MIYCFKSIGLIGVGLIFISSLQAQDQDTAVLSPWEHSLAMNFYLFQDPFIFIPTYEVDKGHLHLGARYNYEDHKTFSAWVGYNFLGGKDLAYGITPMAGVLVGQTNAFAAGTIIRLDFRKFSFYSESEFIFDVVAYNNDFYSGYFYTWTDLSYAFTDWLYAGMSVQKTRLYDTGPYIQRGLLVGGRLYDIDITGYFYELFSEDPFLILTVARDF